MSELRQCPALVEVRASANLPFTLRCDKLEHGPTEKHRVTITPDTGNALKIVWGPGQEPRE